MSRQNRWSGFRLCSRNDADSCAKVVAAITDGKAASPEADAAHGQEVAVVHTGAVHVDRDPDLAAAAGGAQCSTHGCILVIIARAGAAI
jgi:hypothetical protein